MPDRSKKKEEMEISEVMTAISKLHGKVDILLSNRSTSRSGNEACALTVMVNHLVEDVDIDLDRCMVSPCDCRAACKEVFTDFLQRSAKLVGEEKVEEKKLTEMRKELDAIRSKAPYKKCSQCFDEVYTMFDRHVRVIRSQNSFVSDENLRNLIRRMDEEKVVKEVIDPLSNPQRLEIMKSLMDRPKSYSMLSSITGLKGGNLLFHLGKLTSTSMIVQNQERGDYSLTEKGNKVLRYLTLITLEIGAERWV
jgi:DNA-binding transcriptional ArsR family regulator